MKRAESVFVRRATPLVLILLTLMGAFVIDNVCATYYFYVNWMRLQRAADTAVRAGLNYLPKDRELALRTMMHYAEINGVQRTEIVSADVAGDRLSLTIRLRRRLPFYLSGAALGLHNRSIKVSSTAWVQARAQSPAKAPGALTRSALMVTAPRAAPAVPSGPA